MTILSAIGNFFNAIMEARADAIDQLIKHKCYHWD